MKSCVLLAVALVLTAVDASAQQAKTPATAVAASATVSLSVRGADAKPYLTVQATAADIRGLLRDMGKKVGATVYFSPSVAGTFSGTLDGMDPDAAVATVAASAGCRMVRIALPKGAPLIDEDAAGKVYEGMVELPAASQVRDTKSHKTVVVSEAAADAAPDAQVVYYVQGRKTPEEERAGSDKRAADQAAVKAAQASSPSAAIQGAVKAFQGMSTQDRMQALRDMQQQMFQNMTPDERQAMRQAMRRGRGGNNGQ